MGGHGQQPRVPGVPQRRNSQKHLPLVRGQGQWPGGATPHLRPGAAWRNHPAPKAREGGWEKPHVQGAVAVWVQEGLEEPSHVEGQEGQREEIPLIQGKEQRLRCAGAAVKRYPTPKVRETQVRW